MIIKVHSVKRTIIVIVFVDLIEVMIFIDM
jgi:hypothetical protein